MRNLITCLVVCVLSGATFATTWTVDDDGKADFDNIQDAVDAASDGDEIIVMPGTYTGTGEEVIDMQGKAVWLHSSSGSGATIIDGEGMRRGITCNDSETIKTTIEGFTIRRGFYWWGGGGMYCGVFSSPNILNCHFFDNSCDAEGGGLYIEGGSPNITNCIFNSNYATWFGGGIFMRWGGYPTIVNCVFKENIGEFGGGIAVFADNGADGLLQLEGCLLNNNLAGAAGGGIWRADWTTTIVVTETTVCSNSPNQIYGDYTNGGGNTIADECDGSDTDGDGVDDMLDNCEEYNPDQADCNANGIGDVCDLATGVSDDCNDNNIPDECEIDDGIVQDCNLNGVPDSCDISYGLSNDLNNNGIPDECEDDCNNNGYPDDWDILSGLSEDMNIDGIPDECQCIADLNNDGDVNIAELLIIISAWSTSIPIFDINCDGIVNVNDLLIIINNWGPCE